MTKKSSEFSQKPRAAPNSIFATEAAGRNYVRAAEATEVASNPKESLRMEKIKRVLREAKCRHTGIREH